MNLLERFPRAWCPTCDKVQPVILDLMKADDKNDRDAADIICDECKSILVTLHSPKAQQANVRPKRATQAREMAGRELDRLIDPATTDEEKQSRKRRLLKGPKEFRDIRGGPKR